MRSFSGIGLAWFLATVVAVTIAAAAVGSVRSVVTDVPTALGVSALPAIAQVESGDVSESPDDTSDLEQDVTTSTVASIVETATTDPREAETTTATTVPQPAEQAVLTQAHPEHEETKKSRPQGGPTPSATPAPSEPSNTSVTTTSKPTAPATTNATTTTAPQPVTVTTTTTAPQPVTVTTTTTAPPPPTASKLVIELTTTQDASEAYTRVIDTKGGSLSVRVDGDAVVFRRAYPKNGWTFDLADGGPEAVIAQFTRTNDRTMRIKIVATVIDGSLEVSITEPN